jgi:predicted S18 family serine protease
MTVRVSPNTSKEVSISIGESRAGGTQEDWRAAAWISAFSAAQTTNTLISDHEFMVKPGTGHIGGPSAGMLMTATMVALIRGDAIQSGIGMTGTINPDGSIGPVGGIPNKLEGAHKNGIKKFGYPKGQRFSMNARDLNRKDGGPVEPEDLIKKGADLGGIEVVEIGDVYDAYHLLTGKALERPSPASVSQLSFSPALAERMRGAISRRIGLARQRYNNMERKFNDMVRRQKPLWQKEALSQISGKGAAELAAKIVEAKAEETLKEYLDEIFTIKYHIARSQKYLREGSLSMALMEAAQADGDSRDKELHLELQLQLNEGAGFSDYERIFEDQFAAAGEVLASVRSSLSSAITRSSVGAKIDGLHCFENYWQARALRESGSVIYKELVRQRQTWMKTQERAGQVMAKIADNKRAKKPLESGISETDVAFLKQYREAQREYQTLASNMTTAFAHAQSRAEACSEWASFFQEAGPPVRDQRELFQRLGAAYSTAAGAGLKWFKSIVVNNEAENVAESLRKDASATVSIAQLSEVIDNELLLREPEYAPVAVAAEFAHYSDALKEKDSLLPLDQLASGVYAYFGCASLLNKYYNYGQLDLDSTGEERPSLWVARRKTLSHNLEIAKQGVLISCGKLHALVGFVPDCVKINFDLANDLRDGTDDNRMSALKAYWKCQFLCDLALRLLTQAQ